MRVANCGYCLRHLTQTRKHYRELAECPLYVGDEPGRS